MLGRSKQPGRRRGVSPFVVGLIGLAITLPVIYLGFTKSIPFRDHFEIKAAFETANNLKPNSPVRIAGVNVGKVTSVEERAAGEDGAIVTMRIEDKGLPIHKDAQVKIRSRIFLEGNFFLDVRPGSPSQPVLDDGDMIPVQQTAAPVQFDQLLTALQDDTREELGVLLEEYGKAVNSKGGDGYRRSIKYWEPAYKNNAIVNEALLGERDGDLSGYLRGATRVADALDRNAGQLKSLITDFNTTARAFAREDVALQRAIAELPRTLRAAQPALAKLNAAFPPLRRLVADLRPGVRSTVPAIQAQTPFVRQLRGLVQEDEAQGLARDLRAAVPSLVGLNETTVPLARQARRLAACQTEVIIPWGNDRVVDPEFEAGGRVHEQFGHVLPGLAGESRSGDANGQWFRVLLGTGTNLVTLRPGVFTNTALPILGVNPPKPVSRPPLEPEQPCEDQETPDLRSQPGSPPPQRRLELNADGEKRLARSREDALAFAREALEREGLDQLMRVSDEDATPGLIQQLGQQVRAARAADTARIRKAGR